MVLNINTSTVWCKMIGNFTGAIFLPFNKRVYIMVNISRRKITIIPSVVLVSVDLYIDE